MLPTFVVEGREGGRELSTLLVVVVVVLMWWWCHCLSAHKRSSSFS